jgi:DNA-binding response OmpR family regulator
MDTASEAPAGIAFGRFLLLPHRGELLADGRPVKLGGRAFDVLMALIEAHGAVVSKNALMGRVWPNQIVEENNSSGRFQGGCRSESRKGPSRRFAKARGRCGRSRATRSPSLKNPPFIRPHSSRQKSGAEMRFNV